MENTKIAFNNFTFKYFTQEDPTLYDINLKIKEGEKILIVGASGSGKSTLGHCLNGLIPFAYKGDIEGSVKINGVETRTEKLHIISKSIGTVIQDTDAQFVGQTVGEDIAFSMENDLIPTEEMRQKVLEVSRLVGMENFLKDSPYQVSGGQKQRTSIAGILVDDVDILLFDEPLANLDPKTGRVAIEIIDEIHRKHNKTTVIIEHRIEDVLYRNVDRIILVSDGRIISDTNPNDLLKSDLLIKNGIREPLYVTLLKYIGQDISNMDLSGVDTLDYDEIRNKVEGFIQKERPKDQIYNEQVLEIENVSFSYEGVKNNLEDVSFSVYKGEMLAIAGKNGAGKSTLAKLICGFNRPDKGLIKINGKDYSDLSIKEIAENVAYVMQNPNQMISKAMIYDEVALGLRFRGVDEEEIRDRVERVLKICGLDSFIDWPISALSYGQKKRVTIASILVLNPDIIILDEPTAGQDYKHYTEIMEFLESLNKQGVTVILITHDMHLMLEYTQRSIVFSEGKLIADDKASVILTKDEVIEKGNLVETSLYTIAKRLNLEKPSILVDAFVNHERRIR
ncbi:ABC transporter ATP-binding protein [Helcococcus sueciensis]|uniref:ABC transporter ATP-binding protein n=1 Tax=Helcococcus sueciensis TaxID=241555 RepID=UPI000419A27F|nr:ABC transporter ATP-binding protein [Helcococcus sueciensis]